MLRVGDEVWFDAKRRVFVPPQRRSIGYVTQESSLFAHLSVEDNLLYGSKRLADSARRASLDDVVDGLGLKALLSRRVTNLSGGERGRLHLAKTLIAGGNVLMLDEPSNDLDVETLRALEDALLEFAGSIMVISHDRWFLDRIATHILAAEGDSKWVFFDGNYQEYEADKKKRLGEEGARPKRVRFKALK